MYLTQMLWPHNVQIKLPTQFPSFFLSFVLLQPQHPHAPLFSFPECSVGQWPVDLRQEDLNEMKYDWQTCRVQVHIWAYAYDKINWMHFWSCLCKAKPVNETPMVLGLFLWISVKNIHPLVILCVINWTTNIFGQVDGSLYLWPVFRHWKIMTKRWKVDYGLQSSIQRVKPLFQLLNDPQATLTPICVAMIPLN